MAYFNNLKIGNDVEFVGKFYLRTSEDIVPGVKLLKDYKKTSYDLYDDIPHSFVEGQKIGLKKDSVYKVTMYTDAGYEITSEEVIAEPFNEGYGVYLELDDGIILDGVDVEIVEKDDGTIEYVYQEAEGYWVPHNQYFLDKNYGSVYFTIEGCKGDTGEFLTREEIGYETLPLEALPKEIQKVFNPDLNYTQLGFRADLTTAVRIGNLYYFNETIGICPGNTYDICLTSPTNEWEPLPLYTVTGTMGEIPGTIALEMGSSYSTDSGDKDKSEKENKDTRVGLGTDRAYVDNYGNIQHGEGLLLSADIFNYISPEGLKEALLYFGDINWDDLTEEEQNQYLNSTIAVFGTDINGEPIKQKNIKTPTIQTNISGVARSIGGLTKSVEELNNTAGMMISSGDGYYGEVFNDYINAGQLDGVGAYSHTEGVGRELFGYLVVEKIAEYTDTEGNIQTLPTNETSWIKIVEEEEDKEPTPLLPEFTYEIASGDSSKYITILNVFTDPVTEDDYFEIDTEIGDTTEEIRIKPLHAAMGGGAHVEGGLNFVEAGQAHAQGLFNQIPKGDASFVSGILNINTHTGANLLGNNLRSTDEYQTVLGINNDRNLTNVLLAVGAGLDDPANALTLTSDGNLNIKGSLSNPGADYAEYYEWADGNPNNEDRTGHFVTFAAGNKIRLAQPDDGYVLGIVSATPTVVGNAYKEQWQGKYMRDVYGRILTETIEHEEEIIRSEQEEVLEIIPAYTEVKPILNPDYDPTKEYIGRDKRPEWSPVGTHGQLVVLDDGTCQVDAFCALGSNGMATAAAGATPYRVIERLDDTHIKVVLK